MLISFDFKIHSFKKYNYNKNNIILINVIIPEEFCLLNHLITIKMILCYTPLPRFILHCRISIGSVGDTYKNKRENDIYLYIKILFVIFNLNLLFCLKWIINSLLLFFIVSGHNLLCTVPIWILNKEHIGKTNAQKQNY